MGCFLVQLTRKDVTQAGVSVSEELQNERLLKIVEVAVLFYVRCDHVRAKLITHALEEVSRVGVHFLVVEDRVGVCLSNCHIRIRGRGWSKRKTQNVSAVG